MNAFFKGQIVKATILQARGREATVTLLLSAQHDVVPLHLVPQVTQNEDEQEERIRALEAQLAQATQETEDL